MTAASSPESPPSGTTSASTQGTLEVATLGGGCFWCTEAVFSDLRGVMSVFPGYSGGHTPNPTYEQVCEGSTGHAEVVDVSFDPSVISYHDLLSIFLSVHDPTTPNRQGNDVGTQYRSAIFFHDPSQEATARQVIGEVERSGIWNRKIVTEVVPFTEFYPAESYHRQYYRRNPERAYCQAIIAPKVAKFRKHFADRLSPSIS
jgi:peptide-methionine (S)-S-oxide reductase